MAIFFLSDINTLVPNQLLDIDMNKPIILLVAALSTGFLTYIFTDNSSQNKPNIFSGEEIPKVLKSSDDGVVLGNKIKEALSTESRLSLDPERIRNIVDEFGFREKTKYMNLSEEDQEDMARTVGHSNSLKELMASGEERFKELSESEENLAQMDKKAAALLRDLYSSTGYSEADVKARYEVISAE